MFKKMEEERHAHRFASIIAREKEIQHNKIKNNIDRRMGIIQSTSFHFIAQFCLIDHPTVFKVIRVIYYDKSNR